MSLLLHGEQNCISRSTSVDEQPAEYVSETPADEPVQPANDKDPQTDDEPAADTGEGQEKKQPFKNFFNILKKALIEDDGE